MNATLKHVSNFVLALGCASARLPLLAATDPPANGPFPATLQTVSIPGTQGATLTTDVYFPGTNNLVSPDAGRCPVIVLGHGFSQSKDQHVNQGRHLATRGYIVLGGVGTMADAKPPLSCTFTESHRSRRTTVRV